jgi:hypothetical protein
MGLVFGTLQGSTVCTQRPLVGKVVTVGGPVESERWLVEGEVLAAWS